jgi:predicted transcriptional regulator
MGACIDQSESSVVTDDAEPPQSLAQLTTEVVSAYVSHNEVAQSDLGTLINTVASQLAKIRVKVEPQAEEKPEPAVSMRRSIRPG